jgi:hypothetical protein
MAHLVSLLDEGLFNSVIIDRNRIYSQIIDNLNKAAVVGFPYQEIGHRLKTAWSGEPGQSRVYQDAQSCASLFREYCHQHNLLDFSLQIEVFWNHLWKSSHCKEYLTGTYKHLLLKTQRRRWSPMTCWLSDPQAESALVIYDTNADIVSWALIG